MKKVKKIKKAHHPDLLEIKHVVSAQKKRVARSICSVRFFLSALKTLVLMLMYYVFSIGLTFYNRYLFQNSGVALSVTLTHLLFKFVMAGLLRSILECKSKEPRIMLEWGPYVKKVALAGIVSALDIGLSNWSFEFITVSLYTMCKSTAIIFILLFALLFRLERFRWSLVLVVIFIFVGLFLFTYKSMQFNLQGFILVMIASVLGGLRWNLAQIILQKNEIGLTHPLDMMYHIQPWMIVALFPLSAGIEGMTIAGSATYFRFTDWSVLLGNAGLVLLGGFQGFMLEFSEFLLISQTSSLTFSVSGIFKELCIFVVAVVFKHNPVTPINFIGIFVCMLGIVVHVITKAVSGNEENAKSERHSSSESLEMLKRDGNANDNSDDSEVDLFSADRDR